MLTRVGFRYDLALQGLIWNLKTWWTTGPHAQLSSATQAELRRTWKPGKIIKMFLSFLHNFEFIHFWEFWTIFTNFIKFLDTTSFVKLQFIVDAVESCRVKIWTILNYTLSLTNSCQGLGLCKGKWSKQKLDLMFISA